jgi:hypothetical protein
MRHSQCSEQTTHWHYHKCPSLPISGRDSRRRRRSIPESATRSLIYSTRCMLEVGRATECPTSNQGFLHRSTKATEARGGCLPLGWPQIRGRKPGSAASAAIAFPLLPDSLSQAVRAAALEIGGEAKVVGEGLDITALVLVDGEGVA